MRAKISLMLCVVLLLGTAGGAGAQRNLGDDQAIRALYDGLFEALRNGGPQGLTGYLGQTGSIDARVLRRLEREAQAVLELNPSVGRPDSWVMIRETEIPKAQRYRTVYALTHHEGRPVAWRLHFYKKVNGVWVFTNVRWEAEFVEDFLNLSELEFVAYRKLLGRDRED